MGADAVSAGCIVGGDNQDQQLRMLGRISKEALRAEMPLICHIYPRGNHITGADQYSVENVTYAARAAAELAAIAGIADIQALGMELFTAKSAVAGCTPRSLIFRDLCTPRTKPFLKP